MSGTMVQMEDGMRRLFSNAIIGVALAGVSAIAGAQGNRAPAHRGGRAELRGSNDSTRVWQRDSARFGSDSLRRRGRPGEMAARAALKGVKLTEAQKKSLKDIHQKYAAEMKQLREQNGQAAQQQGAKPNAQLREKYMALEERERTDIRNILTPEQRTQFDANVAKLKERAAKGKHRKPIG